MNDDSPQPDAVPARRIRRLAWLTIALAFAPLMGLALAILYEALFPPKGHNPFVGGGNLWMGIVMVLAITAPVHVPYLGILCATAWGLFQHHSWARAMALILAPLAAILSLFAWGGTIVALHSWLVKGLTDSTLKETVVVFAPTAVLSAVYPVAAFVVLLNRGVRDLFALKS